MIPGVRLVVLGKQGAGKGTQCLQLARHYVVPHISTGDMFRAARKAGTEMGRVFAGYLAEGKLVPDEVVIGIVAERLSERDARGRGFILDGFPRTTHQAQALTKLLQPMKLDAVIDLEVPTEVVVQRLQDRRVCVTCGHNYSVQQRPKFDWSCDYYLKHKRMMPADGIDQLRAFDSIYLGAVTTIGACILQALIILRLPERARWVNITPRYDTAEWLRQSRTRARYRWRRDR